MISPKKKRCEYHKRDCIIWKNFEGKKFCKEGWLKYQLEHKLKKNKSETSSLVKTLDTLLRKILLYEKPSRCYTCGYVPREKSFLQVGHFIKRGVLSTRWDLQNVELQCQRCNCELLGNLEVYGELLGEERVVYLREKARLVTKLSQSDLEGIKALLLNRLNQSL